MDTIFALATVPGKSGVAVVRVSGLQSFETCKLFGFEPFAPRRSGLRKLIHAEMGFLDEALVLLFEEGASFTGERSVELHLHGSIAITRAVLDALSQMPGFKPAAAGEFTRRALENGRLDLTQVEALSDLIDAETEAQRKQALSGFTGNLRDEAEHWRTELIHALSLLEATIDFADEDVPVDVSQDVQEILERVTARLEREINGFGASERVRTGFEVAIVGVPNAGKSTLLNSLAGREAAITSEVAGTTRDVIEVRMDLHGLPVTFLDTAGLRETQDEIEVKGIQRAKDRARAADLRIFLVLDGEMPILDVEDGDIVVEAKSDLVDGGGGVSGLTGEGVQQLMNDVKRALSERAAGAGLVSHARQKDVVLASLSHIQNANGLAAQGSDMYDLASEELRLGVFMLQRLLGRVDVEDVLDRVFSSFCIGK